MATINGESLPSLHIEQTMRRTASDALYLDRILVMRIG
jgi:hypothetical protein